MSEKRINNSDLHQENIDTKDDSVLNKVSEEISDLPEGDGNSTVSGKQAKKKRGSRGKGRRKKRVMTCITDNCMIQSLSIV